MNLSCDEGTALLGQFPRGPGALAHIDGEGDAHVVLEAVAEGHVLVLRAQVPSVRSMQRARAGSGLLLVVGTHLPIAAVV